MKRALGTLAARTGHRCEQQPAVDERARHRPRVVEAPRQRHDSLQRDPAAGRLDRRRAAASRRDAQRPRGIGSGGGGHHLRRQRSRRAAARAARRALERPGAADLIRRAARGELMRVEVAEQYHPGPGQPLPGIAVLGRRVVEQAARRRQRLAGDAVEILQPDRDSSQHGRRPIALHAGRAQSLVRPRGGSQRIVVVDPHPGVDRARISLAAVPTVALTDPVQARRDELRRRGTLTCQQRRRLGDSESGQVTQDVTGRAQPGP